MIFSRLRLIFSLVFIFIFLSSLISGCTPAQQPEFGFNPKLSISEPPVLGKPVKVTLTFTPQEQFDTYSMQIVLPPEMYEVVEGNLELHGVPGKANSLTVTIKSIQVGGGEILGLVKGDTPRSTPWEHVTLFIQIYNDSATILGTTQPKFEPPKVTPTRAYPTPPRTLLPKPPDSSEGPRPGETIAPLPPTGGNAPQRPVVGFNPQLSVSEAPGIGKTCENYFDFRYTNY